MSARRPAKPERAGGGATAQAWVSLRSEDPEAASAFGVARERLAAARSLCELRRYRVFELRGALPATERLESLLHRSTQFYNPGKERCRVRRDTDECSPVRAGDVVALVAERGGDRRTAAERWWRHETGERIEVREGVAWVMRFEPAAGSEALAAELAIARGRDAGLFCNPNSQVVDVVAGPPPIERWPGTRRGRGGAGRRGRTP